LGNAALLRDLPFTRGLAAAVSNNSHNQRRNAQSLEFAKSCPKKK
jgi:hypothetical protein